VAYIYGDFSNAPCIPATPIETQKGRYYNMTTELISAPYPTGDSSQDFVGNGKQDDVQLESAHPEKIAAHSGTIIVSAEGSDQAPWMHDL